MLVKCWLILSLWHEAELSINALHAWPWFTQPPQAVPCRANVPTKFRFLWVNTQAFLCLNGSNSSHKWRMKQAAAGQLRAYLTCFSTSSCHVGLGSASMISSSLPRRQPSSLDGQHDRVDTAWLWSQEDLSSGPALCDFGQVTYLICK